VFAENEFSIFNSMLKNVRKILIFELYITNISRKEQKCVDFSHTTTRNLSFKTPSIKLAQDMCWSREYSVLSDGN
jgi:hypothetical protein